MVIVTILMVIVTIPMEIVRIIILSIGLCLYRVQLDSTYARNEKSMPNGFKLSKIQLANYHGHKICISQGTPCS